MNPLMVDPQSVLTKALKYEGKPYIFGRKGPDAFDCSGLVTWCMRLAGGPNWVYTRNAQHLFDELEPCDSPSGIGVALAFYGSPSDVDHVMFALGDGRAYGACGGDHTTTSVTEAVKRNARVQFRSAWAYRKDLLGFRNFSKATNEGGNAA